LPRRERRAQILEAAARAFLARGFAGTSMDDVAKAAGVTRLIVYRIFESKQDLYRAVLDEVVEDLARSFTGDSVERLQRERAFTRTLLEVGRRHPDGFRLLWRHAAHEAEFAPLALMVRSFAYDYAESLLSSYVSDKTMLHWSARAILGYLQDGICTWLDDGDPERDADLVKTLGVGLRALVTAWNEQGET
jgi:AcrR family transcriptional regulator